MLKIKSFIKKNKKKVIIATTIFLVAIAGTSYYFYNNNKAYNSYLNEFEKYGYSNTNLFWEDNTFVKSSTLDYMQYTLDNRVVELKTSNEYLDQFITDNSLEVIDVSELNYYQENQSKEEIVSNYINQVSTDNELEIDSTLSTSEQIDLLNSKLNEILETKYNNLKSITSKDLTSDEEKTRDNLKEQKKDINTSINSDTGIKVKLELIEDIKDLNSDIKDFNSEVSNRIEKEEEQASQTSTTSNYSSNDYYNDSSSNSWTDSSSNSWTDSSSNSWTDSSSNSWTDSSSNSWTDSSSNSWTDSSSNTSSNSTSSSSSSSSTKPSYQCAYLSESEAIADGKASGRGWDVTNCGDGSYDLYLFDAGDEDMVDWGLGN